MLCFVKLANTWPLHFDLCSKDAWLLTGLLKFMTHNSSEPYSLLYQLMLTPYFADM